MTNYGFVYGERNQYSGYCTWTDPATFGTVVWCKGTVAGLHGNEQYNVYDVTPVSNTSDTVNMAYGVQKHWMVEVRDWVPTSQLGDSVYYNLRMIHYYTVLPVDLNLPPQNVDDNQFSNATDDLGTWDNAYSGLDCTTQTYHAEQDLFSLPVELQEFTQYEHHTAQLAQPLDTVPHGAQAGFPVEATATHNEPAGQDTTRDILASIAEGYHLHGNVDTLETSATGDIAGSCRDVIGNTAESAYQLAEIPHEDPVDSSVPSTQGHVSSLSNDHSPQGNSDEYAAIDSWLNDLLRNIEDRIALASSQQTRSFHGSTPASSLPSIHDPVASSSYDYGSQDNDDAYATTAAWVSSVSNVADDAAAPVPRYAQNPYGCPPASSVPARLRHLHSPALSNTTGAPSPADSLFTRRSASTQATTPGISPLVSFATIGVIDDVTQAAATPSTGNGQQQAKGKGKGKKPATKTAKASKPKPKPKPKYVSRKSSGAGSTSASASALSTSDAYGSFTFTFPSHQFAETTIHDTQAAEYDRTKMAAKGIIFKKNYHADEMKAQN